MLGDIRLWVGPRIEHLLSTRDNTESINTVWCCLNDGICNVSLEIAFPEHTPPPIRQQTGVSKQTLLYEICGARRPLTFNAQLTFDAQLTFNAQHLFERIINFARSTTFESQILRDMTSFIQPQLSIQLAPTVPSYTFNGKNVPSDAFNGNLLLSQRQFETVIEPCLVHS